MKAKPTLTQWILLTAAGGASFYGASQLGAPDAAQDSPEALVRDVSAKPVASASAAEVSVAASPAPTVGPLARQAIETGSAAEVFKGMSWNPPPPAPPPAPVQTVLPPPPPPSAPPLPFKFIGMLEQKSDQPTAFLAKGDALHVVKVGDVVDGTYRIEALSPTQVVVMYLPLKQQQTLGVDGGNP